MAKKAKAPAEGEKPKLGTSARFSIDEEGKVSVRVSHAHPHEDGITVTKCNEDLTDLIPANVKKQLTSLMKEVIGAAGPHVEQIAKGDAARLDVARQGGPDDPRVKKLGLKADLKTLGSDVGKS
jgi:hypothetical protein